MDGPTMAHGSFPPITAPDWTITAQRQDHQPGPDGKFQQGVVVSFTTSHGDAGSVFVPMPHYSAAAVHAAVDQLAQEFRRVRHMQAPVSGTPTGR